MSIDKKISLLTVNMNHSKYMKEAYEVSKESTDPSSKMGCVIVFGDEIIARGVNQFPVSCQKSPEMTNDRPMKYLLIIHAEMDALNSALRSQVIVRGSSLYVTSSPCENCLKHCIHAGISEIIYNEYYPRFSEESKSAIGRLIRGSGIKVTNLDTGKELLTELK